MAKNITKRDLIDDIVRETSMSQGDVKKAVESFLSAIRNHLQNYHTIEIRGFGTFTHVHRKSRPARNPHTGEVVQIEERLVPVLRFCDSFRDKAIIHAIAED